MANFASFMCLYRFNEIINLHFESIPNVWTIMWPMGSLFVRLYGTKPRTASMSSCSNASMANMLPSRYHSIQHHWSNVSLLPALICRFYFKIASIPCRPVSDNRASLLRAPPKKTPSEAQRDALSKLWRNQVAMIMRLVPQIPSVAIRCASPDLSLRYVDLWIEINYF